MDYTIRILKKDDYNKEYLNLLEQLTIVNKKDISYQNFCDFIDLLDNNHIIFVIEDNNKIIATTTLLIENKLIHGLGKVGHIEDVVVDKDYNGKNIGKYIVNHVVAYCEKEECYKVILDCNNDVKNFYEKCGFVCKGNMMAKYF